MRKPEGTGQRRVPVNPDRRVDADFAEAVLSDLYRYPRKRPWVAFALWLLLGWFGGHRFYLDRHGTALLMLFTGGGLLVWWFIDGFLLRSMIRTYNMDQKLRERMGHPPRELDFMPPLSRDVLARPPQWTVHWRAAGRGRRNVRLAGDLVVLLIVALALGVVARQAGVYEAVLAIAVLAAVTSAGAAAGSLNNVPVVRELVQWSHRLRLFYYYNAPGAPLALVFRPVTAAVLAPFRRRDRAEVRLYLQLGGVFTLLFLLLDLGGEIASSGLAALSPAGLFQLWVEEATVTFLVIYAFATPIGAVLTLHLLMRSTHTVPRILSALVGVAMAIGLVAA